MRTLGLGLIGLLLLPGVLWAGTEEESGDKEAVFNRLTHELICACPNENWTRTLQGCPDACADPQKFEIRALLNGDKAEPDIVKFLRFMGGTPAVRTWSRGGKTAAAAAEALQERYKPEEVRTLLEGGLSYEETLAFMRTRYGPKVIARAPFSGIHAFIYVAPTILLLAGAVLIIRYLQRRGPGREEPKEASPEVDDAWKKKLEAELKEME